MINKRVVITGIGIYSCIGKNINEVTNSLKEGKSGIGIDSVRREMGYRSTLTGIIDIPNLKGILSRRQRVSLAEEAIYAYVSTREALENAKIDDEFLDNNIIGMIFGNDSSAKAVMESADKIREKKDTRHAVISIYDGKESSSRYMFDTPCTCAIHFHIIDNKLDMSVMMRSNDLWYGFPNDQYCFSKLQKMVADDVDVPVGKYYHFVTNLHIYNDKLKK